MRLLAAPIFSLLFASAAAQSVPPLVNYQGRLTDASGMPMVGEQKLELNIYNSPTGGTVTWGPQVFDNVMLIDGEFNVILSRDTSDRDVTVAFDSPDAYLGIKVGPAGGTVGNELLPRQQFLAVPYAVRSLDADSAGADELEARIDALESLLLGPGTTRMVKTFGPSTASLYGGAVAMNSDGSIIFSGSKMPGGVASFGGEPLESEFRSTVLVKIDELGNHVWSRQFPTEATTITSTVRHSLAIDGDGNIIFASGTFGEVDFGGGPIGTPDAGSLALVKLTPDGDHIWSDTYPVGNPIVKLTTGGDVIFSGTFSSTFQLGDDLLENNGRTDIVLARFSGEDGSPTWARRYGSARDEQITGMVIAPNDDIVLAGQYEATLNIGTINIPHHGMVSNSWYNRPFFARISSAGTPIWANGFAHGPSSLTHQDNPGGIGLDSDGNIWSALYFFGARDFGGGPTGTGTIAYLGLVSFDPDGEWRANYFWTGFQRPGLQLVMYNDAPIISGKYSSNTPQNFGGGPIETGLLTLAMERGIGETTLEHRWSNSIGTSNTDISDMELSGNKLIQLGSFNHTVDFGTGPITPPGSGIYLVVRNP